MQSFLNSVSEEIIKNHANELGEVSIILPSRRAAVFLKNNFRQQIKETSWLPKIFSLEDFIVSLGDLSIVEQIDLIFELYEVHRKIEGKDAEPFEDFMSWGGILLQDFNEVDRYLIDVDQLYDFLAEAKAIENWDLQAESMSDFQKRYLHFWKRLAQYYKLFKKQLLQQKKAYQGLAFRIIASTIEEQKFKLSSHLYFAGFNALTKSEQKIIDVFVKDYDAKLLWDADKYYMEDQLQEAGKFLRKYQKNKPSFNWIFDDLNTAAKEINIYGISGDVAQAKLIGDLLSKETNPEKINNTAVVLGDENLLVPVLESIPQNIQNLNVTMGYPLQNSILFHFFVSVISIHNQKSKKDKDNQLYFKDVLKLIEQPALQTLGTSVVIASEDLAEKIKKDRLIYVPISELNQVEEAINIKFINLKSDKPKTLVKALLAICKKIKTDGENQLNEIEKELLYAYYKVLNRIADLIARQEKYISFETLLQLFKQVVATESIAFVGEPLKGLQLMGVLESRTLDFEQLILSSLNEGVLPAGKKQNSFIPYDIKRKFKLPSYKEKDAIFAYHFYRLLQRAKKVDLIYNSSLSILGGGERSRFIEQIIYELPKKNPNVKVNHHTLSPPVPTAKENPFKIEKTAEHIAAIKKHLESGLSPSALNTYITCPLNYYYKYLLGLKEEELIAEQIQMNSFGDIVHRTLEHLYQPFVDCILTLENLRSIASKLNHELLKNYEAVLKINPQKGNHKLAFEVAKKMIQNFLQTEKKSLQEGNEIHLLGLEKTVEHLMEIKLDEHTVLPIKIKGKIDRLDRFNGKMRIIDYKSNKVEAVKMNKLKADQLQKIDKSIARQLTIYQMVFEQTKNEAVVAGVIPLKNISAGFLSLKEENAAETTTLLLKEVVAEMIDKEEDFVHNEAINYCAFC